MATEYEKRIQPASSLSQSFPSIIYLDAVPNNSEYLRYHYNEQVKDYFVIVFSNGEIMGGTTTILGKALERPLRIKRSFGQCSCFVRDAQKVIKR